MRLANSIRARFAAPSVFMSGKRRYSSYQIGDWSYGRPNIIHWDCGGKLIIGRFCSIADGVDILLGGEHHADWVTAYPFSLLFADAKNFPGYPLTKGDVVIGNDVWIGRNVLILSGVHIGDGAVVGAGSVVTKSVDSYAIVAGNPARMIRSRFPDDVKRKLQEIAWWNWPIEQIKNAWPLLLSSDVAAFIRKYHRP